MKTIATALLLLFALTACSSDEPALSEPVQVETHTPHPAPTPATDMTNSEDVAETYARMVNTHDTRIDTGPADAMRRVQDLTTPELQAGLGTLDLSGGSQWLDLARHDGYTEVTDLTRIEMNPPHATDTTQWYDYEVQVQWNGRDSWPGDTTSRIMNIEVTKQTDGTWLVSDIAG